MTNTIKALIGVTAIAALAGCVEDTGGSAPVNDGLSGTQAQMDSMMEPCMDEARRVTGTSGDIYVIDQMRTGGGPLVVLDVAGQRMSCRLESNGTVTVFSEFAN